MPDFRYPTRKLSNSDDYLHIRIVKYSPPGIPSLPGGGAASPSTKDKQVTLIHNIYLPMPQDIADSNSVDWGDDSLNPVAAAGVGLAQGVISGGDYMSGITKAISSAIGMTEDAVIGGNAQGAIQTGFAALAVQSLGANVTAEGLLSRSTGQVLNPNMELLFKGVKLRSFNFSYDLVARDSNESAVIKGLIRTLKQSMAAKKSGAADSGYSGLFISAPDVFQLEYKKGSSKHPFLPTFKPMALLGLNVNYTGSGTYATYSDGTPVHLNVALSFQELNPVYYEDYNDANAQIGVGY